MILKPLERAMLEHEDLFRKHFMAQPAALGSAKFAALHEAFVSSGTFVYVPRGVEVELPIEIFHWLHGEDAAVFPHTLLIADELSKVTVIEHFRSAHPDAARFCLRRERPRGGPRREDELRLRAKLERKGARRSRSTPPRSSARLRL